METPTQAARRRFLACAGAWLALPRLAGCAAAPDDMPAWQARLDDDTIVLLGEVHDNAEHHRLRAAALRRACEGGWRPALVMEQFDLDRQADLERARRERPLDVKFLIASASGSQSGWQWDYYEPLVALALAYELPLLAGNLPRAQAGRIVRESYAGAFDPNAIEELGLADRVTPSWQAAQENEVDAGHCGALPRALLPGMAQAQLARDAVMAQLLRRHGAKGVVLLAGNGHVRRDLGVPRWLSPLPPARLLAVGYLEAGDAIVPDKFDAVVVTAAAERDDPCRRFAPR